MKYRRLTPDDDYSFGQGRQDFISDVEAVAQAVYTRLKLLKEEWWEDQEDGLPLFQQIIGKFGPNGNKQAIDLIIKDRIAGTQNVTGIFNFTSEFNPHTRQYTFHCSINTKYGDTELIPMTF